MQRVLEEVNDGWLPVIDLAGRIEGVKRPHRAAIESTRRACKRLAAHGHVQVDYVFPGTGELWSEGSEKGYDVDARPAHPSWRLVVRRTPGTRETH
jgi:hypothetical protein